MDWFTLSETYKKINFPFSSQILGNAWRKIVNCLPTSIYIYTYICIRFQKWVWNEMSYEFESVQMWSAVFRLSNKRCAQINKYMQDVIDWKVMGCNLALYYFSYWINIQCMSLCVLISLRQVSNGVLYQVFEQSSKCFLILEYMLPDSLLPQSFSIGIIVS